MRPGVLPMTTKQSDRFLNWILRHPSAEETEIPKVRIEAMLIIFFGSQGVVHKELVPEGKNSERRILNRSNGPPPEAHTTGLSSCVFLLRFFLLHYNAPAHKAASVCQFFDPQKCYNSLSPPPALQTYLRHFLMN
jgi:hypothetical protein